MAKYCILLSLLFSTLSGRSTYISFIIEHYEILYKTFIFKRESSQQDYSQLMKKEKIYLLNS